jgi:hypothetical protein
MPTIESRLKETLFLVEANSFETLCLWQQHSSESPQVKAFKFGAPLKWEQDAGFNVEVGQLDKRPIRLEIQFVKIEGCWVGFWHCPSQLADYAMITKWLEKNFKGKYDNQQRQATCDAMNFGHCISALKEAVKNR